jgi:hypothetical protein
MKMGELGISLYSHFHIIDLYVQNVCYKCLYFKKYAEGDVNVENISQQ